MRRRTRTHKVVIGTSDPPKVVSQNVLAQVLLPQATVTLHVSSFIASTGNNTPEKQVQYLQAALHYLHTRSTDGGVWYAHLTLIF